MIDDVIARWHRYMLGELPGGLDDLLAENVVFYSPVVYTPQRGKPVTTQYLEAAAAALAGGPDGAFQYTKQVLAGDTAVLEFETSVEGKYVNGVDIIRCDDTGRIVEFRVMMRPLQAIQAVHEQMGRRLAAGSRSPRSGRRVAGSVNDMAENSSVVVVTGANGLVGAAVCRALVEREAQVRAIVRRAGSAPALPGVTEHVGDFADEGLARAVVQGADAVVTTVHPMGSSREAQHRVGVEGTALLARAARDAGVARFVHMSTAGVYDRSAGVGDVAEDGALLPEGSGDYPDTKNAADAALAQVAGLTTVLVRPPAILGAGETSVWNTLRPQQVRDGERRANPAKTWAWVHVDDLAALIADVATGTVATSDDPERGPEAGSVTPVIVAGEPATWRDYLGTVTDALGVEPEWTDEQVWTGQLRADRARGWGWAPRVGLAEAMAELRRSVTALE